MSSGQPVRSHLGIAAALLAANLSGGCHEARVQPRSFVIAIPFRPSSLLPNQTAEPTALRLLGNVYETLVDLDANTALRPGLAESWYSPDERVWVFRIRAGVHFHDGRRLTAAHVVASLDHARLDRGSTRRGELAVVSSVRADDDQTVTVRLSRPLDTLAARLSRVSIWAPAVHKDEPPLGTGPYRIWSWGKEGSLRIEAFEGYDRGAPRLRDVRFEPIPDPQARMRALAEGRVELVADAPFDPTPLPALVSRVDGIRVVFLSFDCGRVKSPYLEARSNPFRDRRVRQALALAVDRDRPAGSRVGALRPVDQIATPEELGAYGASLPSRPHDLPGARRLLRDAGHGAGFEVTLDYVSEPELEVVAEAVVADLLQAGIRVRPRPQSESSLARRVESRDTSFCLRVWLNETGDARASYEQLLHTQDGSLGLANAGGYSNLDLDDLIRQASAATRPDERRLLLARLGTKVALEAPIVPLFALIDRYAVAPGVVFQPRRDRQLRAAEMDRREAGP